MNSTVASQIYGLEFDDQIQRQRLRKWAEAAGCDQKSVLLFLSLMPEHREAVRDLGSLSGANVRNPSQLLMSRIRQVWPDYIVLDAQAEGERRASYQPVASDDRKSLIILFRGEAERAGGHRQHGFSEELETFKDNMESFFWYLFKPLLDTQKYKLAIFADLRAQEDRTSEIKTFLRKTFGKVFLASRVQLELLGRSQIDSITSAWDWMAHEVGQRSLDCVGAFVLRVDIRLKSSGFHTWDFDKLCFLWHTTALKRKKECANDTLFFVPVNLFQRFRSRLSKPIVEQHLHWLSVVPEFEDQCFFEFQMSQPSSTENMANPRYRFTDRSEGKFDIGKWRHYELSLSQEPGAQTLSVKTFNDRVCEVMDAAVSAGKSHIEIENFKDHWYTVFSDEYLGNYLGSNKVTKVLQQCSCVEVFHAHRSSPFPDAIRWPDVSEFVGEGNFCCRCHEHKWSRPLIRCQRCDQTVCIGCADWSAPWIGIGWSCKCHCERMVRAKKMPRRERLVSVTPRAKKMPRRK